MCNHPRPTRSGSKITKWEVRWPIFYRRCFCQQFSRLPPLNSPLLLDLFMPQLAILGSFYCEFIRVTHKHPSSTVHKEHVVLSCLHKWINGDTQIYLLLCAQIKFNVNTCSPVALQSMISVIPSFFCMRTWDQFCQHHTHSCTSSIPAITITNIHVTLLHQL